MSVSFIEVGEGTLGSVSRYGFGDCAARESYFVQRVSKFNSWALIQFAGRPDIYADDIK